jgi:PKD repeat protein
MQGRTAWPVTATIAVAAVMLGLCSPALAQRPGGGGGGYDLFGCSSDERGYSDLCRAERPTVEIFSSVDSPRAGAVVPLEAYASGREVTFAWDLDDDGQFDDATGGTASRSFAAGTARVSVRATDEDGRTASETRTFEVHAGNRRPVVSVSAFPAAPSVGQQIDVSAYGSDTDGTIAKVELDLDGNGTFEATQSDEDGLTTSFASAGSHVLRARVTDDGGDTATSTVTVDVHAGNIAPAPSLTVSPTSPEPGQTVSLSSFATDPDGHVVKYEFDLDGDGTYETDRGSSGSAQTSFPAVGVREVGVRVTDDRGATGISRRTLHVEAGGENEPPTVSIGRSLSVRQLFAQAQDPDGSIAEYAWDFDEDGVFDDVIGSSQSFVTFPASPPGDYRVAVRVTDNEGAATTRRTIVRITGAPATAPQLFITPSQPRAGQSVTFSVSDYGESLASSEWDLDGDGALDDGASFPSPSASFTYGEPGSYAIRVRVTDENGNTAMQRGQVTVSPATGNLSPGASMFAFPARPRVGTAVSLSDGSFDADGSIASRAWDLDADGQFDDSTSPSASVTFDAAGPHDVALRVTDNTGAQAIQRRTLDVHAEDRPPRVRVFLIENSQGLDGEVVMRPGQSKTFTASVDNDENGPPNVAWDTDEDGQFDDATGSTASVSFATEGLHHVSARATDAAGSDTGVMLADVRAAQGNRAPRFDIQPPFGGVRPGQQVNLFASGSDPDGDAVAYAWDLDDDGQFDDATSSFVTHTFATAGTFEVRARASDGRGGERVQLVTVTVSDAPNLPPTLDVYAAGIARAGRAFRFSVSTYDPDSTSFTQPALSFDMDGDGAFDDTPTSSFGGGYSWTFPAAGRVTVAARATDQGGLSTTRTFDLEVTDQNLAPVASLEHAALIAGQATTFGVYAYDPDDPSETEPLTYGWDLDGDGAYDDATGPSVTHTYATRGEQVVGVEVSDADGGRTAVRRRLTVSGRQPAATFTSSDTTPDPGQTVTLTSTATDPDGGAIASRAWDLDGDGQFDDGTGTTATVSFAEPGQRLVGHKVRDADGDNGIRYDVITVNSAETPVASFTSTPNPARVNQSVTFTSTATDPQGPSDIVSRAWDLDGDGDYDDATGATASKAFPTAGSKPIGLLVTDAAGHEDTAHGTVQVTANVPPVAGFTRSPSSPQAGQEVTFTSTATDADGSIATVNWDLDDDGAYDDADGATAKKTFDSAGQKTVRQEVTDNDGATATTSSTFDVAGIGTPVADFAFAPAQPRIGEEVTFTSTSTDADGDIAATAWDLDNDGAYDDATGTTAKRTFDTAGSKTVGVRVTDATAKSGTKSRTFTVRPANRAPQVTLSASRTTPRLNQAVTLTADAFDPDGDAISQYAFDLDGDNVFEEAGEPAGSADTAQATFATAGRRTLRVRVRDAAGATSVATATVDVTAGNAAPVLYASADDLSKRRGPAGATFTLYGYAWDPDDAFYDAAADTYDDGIERWDWDLNGDGDYSDAGDRTGATLDSVQVTLGQGGSGEIPHTVHVRVSDTYAADRKSTEQALTLTTYDGNRTPEVQVYHYPYEVQRTVATTFVADAFDPDGDAITGYAWDTDADGQFDDGSTRQVTATFATRGPRTVKARVTDDQGAATVATYAIDVAGARPVARIDSDPFAPEAGQEVQLTGVASDPDGTIASYAWDLDGDSEFDDGNLATAKRTFTGSGPHPVALRVRDNEGDEAIVRRDVVVHAPITFGGAPAGIGTPAPEASDTDGNPVSIGTTVDPATGKVAVRVARGTIATVPGSCVALDLEFPIKGSASNVVLIVRRGAGDLRIAATAVAGKPGHWSAHIDCIEQGDLLVEYDLPKAGGGTDHIGPVPVGGIELIDPQGVVYDQAGYLKALETAGVTEATASEAQKTSARGAAAISGATVTLQRLTGGEWRTVNAADPGISPNTNPLTTGADGLYRWDVSAGTYRVLVSKPGYGTVTSDSAVIPPPKLDLHVPLVRNAAPKAGLELVGTAVAGRAATLRSTSTVANGTLNRVEWDLDDDGAFDDGTGAQVTWTFPTAGARTVRVRAIDGDGEGDVASKAIAVSAPSAAPGPDPTPAPTTGGGGSGGQTGGGQTGGGQTGGGTTPADTTPPGLTVAAPTGKNAKLKALLGAGLPFALTCTEACQVTVTGTIDTATAKRLKLGKKATVVGKVSRALSTGARTTVKLKLTAKAAKAAKKVRSIKIKLTFLALDPAGNKKQVTRTMTVRK